MSDKKVETPEEAGLPSDKEMEAVQAASKEIGAILEKHNVSLITNVSLAGNAINSSVSIVPKPKPSKIIKP